MRAQYHRTAQKKLEERAYQTLAAQYIGNQPIVLGIDSTPKSPETQYAPIMFGAGGEQTPENRSWRLCVGSHKESTSRLPCSCLVRSTMRVHRCFRDRNRSRNQKIEVVRRPPRSSPGGAKTKLRESSRTTGECSSMHFLL